MIAQIADTQPRLAGAVAERLSQQRGLVGLELLIPEHGSPQDAAEMVKLVVRHSDLPVLAKLPIGAAVGLASAVHAAGASALVVGHPLPGAAFRRGETDGSHAVNGPLFGPLVFAPMLYALRQVVALGVGCPIVAGGGLFTLEQVQQALAVGAVCVQLDAVAWVEPGLPAHLAAQLSG